MVGATAVKCLVSRDWFLLALFAVSVSDCVSASEPSDGAEEKLIGVPVDASDSNITSINQLNQLDNAGKELAKNNTYAFEYSKGFRIPGDELLVFDSRFFEFPVQDISLTIFYPKKEPNNEKQFLITNFRVKVHQDSPEGEGYLTAGGIRLEHLGLRIVASKATAFSYDIVIYGILHDLLSPDYNPGILPSDALIGGQPQKLVNSSDSSQLFLAQTDQLTQSLTDV